MSAVAENPISQLFSPDYQPLTSESRVKDFDVPDALPIGGQLVRLPRALTRKDVHYLIDQQGRPVRAAWIHKGLAHILNAFRFDNPDIRRAELERALRAIEDEISHLVKDRVLKDKHGPGAMGLAQANENVPEDALVISYRTWQAWCAYDRRWVHAKTVMAERFPNLGPETTKKLRLVVNKAQSYEKTPATSVYHRVPGLIDLFPELKDEGHSLENTHGVCDAMYLHPGTLKECFEGDGDGDQIFVLLRDRGRPSFQKIRMVREPLPIDDVVDSKGVPALEALVKKSQRVHRPPLREWLPSLIDELPIAAATYMIRLLWFNKLEKFKDTEHPSHYAWKEVAPRAIRIIEFVMDIRKGDWTEEEIEMKMQQIATANQMIRTMQEEGHPFATTVTAQRVMDVAAFVSQFPSLQKYLDEITGQKYVKNLSLQSLLDDED